MNGLRRQQGRPPCGHCVASVTEEVSKLPGVSDVQVKLVTGQLTATGDTTDEPVRAAVEEAGYQLA